MFIRKAALATLSFFCAQAAHAQAGAAPDPNRVVPIEDFARKGTAESVAISPTGQYLAVTYPIAGTNQTALAIIDRKDMKTIGSTRFGTGKHIRQVRWANPERVVYTIAERGGRLDQLRATGELYSMDIHGKRQRTLHLGGGYTFLLDTIQDDPDNVLVMFFPRFRKDAEQPLVYTVNVNDETIWKIGYLPGKSPGVVTDESGRMHFSYGFDDKNVIHLYRRTDDPKKEWEEVSLPEGTPADVGLYGVAHDGTVYLESTEKNGRECLREYRPETGFKDIECNASARAGRPLFGLEDDKIFAFARGDLPGSVQYVDPEHPSARLVQSLQKAFPGQWVSIVNATDDHQTVVFFVSSDRNPGDYYLFDRKARKAQYLMSALKWIDPATMSPMQPIEYKTRDGYTIHGYLTSRNGKNTRNAPLVLMPHGGPHGVRDYWAWNDWGQLLASRGYAVLQVNYRGSGGYGELHEKAGYQKWGTLMQDDLTDAVRWAIGSGIADANRVCIFGASYGGYAALMSPLREPDLYRCAVGFAGVYDIVAHAKETIYSELTLSRNSMEDIFGDAATRRENSPVTHIAKLKIPVLIGHGTNDRIVPFSQAKILRKALEQHQKPYEWVEYMGEEHGLDKDENHVDFLTKLLAFLDKHIGPQSPAAKKQGG